MGAEEPSSRLAAEHTPEAIRRRLQLGARHSYARDFVYGAIDGTVTTFAVVAGSAGAELPPAVVVILGAVNVFGDGFSMATSNFLGTRTERQVREQVRRTEEEHIAAVPEGEREEVRQIFAAKGFSGEALEAAVEVITVDRQRWIQTMMSEEHGLSGPPPSPLRAALSTYVAFILAGLVSLFPFLLRAVAPSLMRDPFPWSLGMTAVTFFVIGAAKARVVGGAWHRSGLETLVVGGLAASLAYAVGLALKGIGG